MEQFPYATSESCDEADSAEIFLSDEGDAVLSFHLTRLSKRDHRPNGIRIHSEPWDVSCVVFVNSGQEAVTVEGEWLEPGKHVAKPERDNSDPKVQEYFWHGYYLRPDVQAECKRF